MFIRSDLFYSALVLLDGPLLQTEKRLLMFQHGSSVNIEVKCRMSSINKARFLNALQICIKCNEF